MSDETKSVFSNVNKQDLLDYARVTGKRRNVRNIRWMRKKLLAGKWHIGYDREVAEWHRRFEELNGPKPPPPPQGTACNDAVIANHRPAPNDKYVLALPQQGLCLRYRNGWITVLHPSGFKERHAMIRVAKLMLQPDARVAPSLVDICQSVGIPIELNRSCAPHVRNGSALPYQ